MSHTDEPTVPSQPDAAENSSPEPRRPWEPPVVKTFPMVTTTQGINDMPGDGISNMS